ncbi:hypothetical protein KDN24_04000 [Bacillus sp. Bva_UNVM-123]|uniref:hypothetical protein n=1 Tax=Bacillus sp. Bva_UNVM-123 TaxID=2829798 RepID=UPI00391F7C6B
MRTWRVGTFSMGASLLFLGIFLLLSQIFGFKLVHVMMSWWPVILIVLGLEILIFLFLSRQEKPFLKYDFFSIFFVGILGMVGIGFAIVSSTGILDKMDEALQREERTIDLPELEYSIKNTVQRIVVDTGDYPLAIEGTSDNAISLFGTYRANAGKKEKLLSNANDYVLIREKGDTLYVSIKGLPSESVGPFNRYSSSSLSATILIPNDIKLEVTGNDNSIVLKPRALTSDWTIDRASTLSVQMEKNSDVMVLAKGLLEIQGDQTNWNVTREQVEDVEEVEETYSDDEVSEQPIKLATYQTGQGTHKLQVTNSYRVDVNIVN